jgi:Fe-S cluster assembly protein SufD
VWRSSGENRIRALIEAMSLDGCVVEVSEGAKIAEPIEFVNIASGEGAYSLYSRIEIALGVGARASFVETFLGAGKAVQRHAATTLTLAKGARLKHVVVVDDAAELHLESQIIELDEKAELNAFAFVSGGVLTRRQIFAKLVGEGAKVALGGQALLDGSRRADTTLQVVHSARGGTSREFYRAIVDDEAIGIFQGKVIVANDAQKTDGAMKSQAILLSPLAQMNTKPELEIFADDVVCGRGATVGSLDPEQVFYLQTRGIPKDVAEAMLLEAFGREAIDRVEDEMLAGALCASLRAWLASMGATAPRHGDVTTGDARVNDFVRTPLEPYDVAKIREDFPILTERP